MKPVVTLILIVLFSLNPLFAQLDLENASGFSPLEGPYLGQKPPGPVPKAFAPGWVSTEHWEYGGVFTPDLNEFYFLRQDPDNGVQECVVVRNSEAGWHASIHSPRTGQPFIAPDGKTMYLGSRYRVRTETGWSELKSLGGQFDGLRIMRLTASARGMYVFDEPGSSSGDGIMRFSRLIDGKREAPRPFDGAINSGTFNAHPFIAADESFMIWDSKREGGFGNSDLYISFREPDGSWGAAINLGDAVNTSAWEAAATVTPDGKYLFFNRNMGSENFENVDIFWIDAQIINTLRPE